MNKSIFICDDDVSITSILEFILQQSGYDVQSFDNGQACLDAIQAEHPVDLVLLDVRMPGITGNQVVKYIQKMKPSLPVIMMTGFATNELLNEAYEDGAYGIIYKPFDIEEVLKIIENIFKHTPSDA